MDTDKSLGARRHRELYLKVLVAAVATAPLLVLVWLFRGDLETLFLDRLIVFASTRLSAEDREAYLRLIADEMPGLFEAVPEPTVGRILMPGSTKEYRGAEVAANNAGMRDAHDYLPKPVGVLRLVCLGDSATLGVGGPERDRWCDQLEESLRERLRPPGVPVEAYTLAVPSWSALNEASYLTSRVSEYRPDIVLGLLVANDISLTSGVTGTGHQTSAFSPERREIGSGAPSVFLPFSFGLARQNLLSSGLGDESRRAWRTAFDAWQRLEGVLERSGGRLVLAAISGIDPLFDELVRHHHAESGLRSPLVFTRAVSRLPHDPHLDRRGHAAIAGHFLHVLAALRWLDLDLEGARPPPAGVDLATVNPPRPERIRALQDEAAAQLPEELAFDRLTVEAVRGLLGGVIPQSTADPLHGGVYGSTETRFLLRRRDESRSVSVAIEVPPREELFPFELELRTQGGPSAALRLDGSGRAGRHQLAVPLAEGGEPVIEVVLETDSYWCEIADPTMKSYRLLSASQQ
jgi:hypothetical protein